MTSNRKLDYETLYDPHLKIWSGKKHKFQYATNVSVGSELLKEMLRRPEDIAQVCFHNGKQYTNQEISEKSISVSMHFNKLGFQQGDVVGFCGANTDFVAPLVFGALLNGLVLSPLDVSFEKNAIKHSYAITKPKIMFCDHSVYKRFEESFDELGLKSKIYTMDKQIANTPHISEFLMETVDVTYSKFSPVPLSMNNDQQPAIILCSSGTTGLSKGICISHAALLSVFFGNISEKGERIFSISSLYWASGIFCLIVGTIKGLTRLLSTQKFTAEHFLDVIEKHKATFIFTPPSQMALLAGSPTIHKRNLQSLQYYFCSGSYIPPSLVKEIKQFIPNVSIIVGYALTEMAGFYVTGGHAVASGSNGKLAANVELRIINDEGDSLGPNEQGEILVRSNIPFIGYYGNPEATAQNCDVDGWIYTGDIGYMDENGELFVLDRKKEVLKYTGFKYFPTEIENIIMQIPEVLEVCVCGIPDQVYTDIPAALITLKPDASLSEADVYEFVAERMDNYKHLRGGIYFVDNIPKTASGKNLRREVVKICALLKSN